MRGTGRTLQEPGGKLLPACSFRLLQLPALLSRGANASPAPPACAPEALVGGARGGVSHPREE
eukprot:6328847-Alexandrium_andersonii.AAC.1